MLAMLQSCSNSATAHMLVSERFALDPARATTGQLKLSVNVFFPLRQWLLLWAGIDRPQLPKGLT